MYRMPSYARLALLAVLLAPGIRVARAADTEQIEAAKRYLTDADRSRAVLFFAHPTGTYRSVEFAKVGNVVDRAGATIDGAFAVTVRYTWRSLFDDTNTSELHFFFDPRGRLTEIQNGRTSSIFPQFTGSDLVLAAVKDDLEKRVEDWQDADARRAARALIRSADTRGLLTLILKVDQP
jgi:hypothetical protein